MFTDRCCGLGIFLLNHLFLYTKKVQKKIQQHLCTHHPRLTNDILSYSLQIFYFKKLTDEEIYISYILFPSFLRVSHEAMTLGHIQ